MRVIAGTAKGRPLTAPRGEQVRPTTDRTKEALFSILHTDVIGASVLDLFAGAGSLGIEALSRGAGHATFVERDRRALSALRANLDATGLGDRATVVAADVAATLRGAPPGAPFDIAFLDPPYRIDRGVLADLLGALVSHLTAGARVTVELGVRGEPPPWPAGLGAGRVRRYGETCLYEAFGVPSDPGASERDQ